MLKVYKVCILNPMQYVNNFTKMRDKVSIAKLNLLILFCVVF